MCPLASVWFEMWWGQRRNLECIFRSAGDAPYFSLAQVMKGSEDGIPV